MRMSIFLRLRNLCLLPQRNYRGLRRPLHRQSRWSLPFIKRKKKHFIAPSSKWPHRKPLQSQLLGLASPPPAAKPPEPPPHKKEEKSTTVRGALRNFCLLPQHKRPPGACQGNRQGKEKGVCEGACGVLDATPNHRPQGLPYAEEERDEAQARRRELPPYGVPRCGTP